LLPLTGTPFASTNLPCSVMKLGTDADAVGSVTRLDKASALSVPNVFAHMRPLLRGISISFCALVGQ
jgi:hypothetical protein